MEKIEAARKLGQEKQRQYKEYLAHVQQMPPEEFFSEFTKDMEHIDKLYSINDLKTILPVVRGHVRNAVNRHLHCSKKNMDELLNGSAWKQILVTDLSVRYSTTDRKEGLRNMVVLTLRGKRSLSSSEPFDGSNWLLPVQMMWSCTQRDYMVKVKQALSKDASYVATVPHSILQKLKELRKDIYRISGKLQLEYDNPDISFPTLHRYLDHHSQMCWLYECFCKINRQNILELSQKIQEYLTGPKDHPSKRRRISVHL